MVIINSDSNTTLVSLDPRESSSDKLQVPSSVHRHGDRDDFGAWSSPDDHRHQHRHHPSSDGQLVRTELVLLAEDPSTDEDQRQSLYLPRDGQRLDEHLKGNAAIRASCDQLLMMDPVRLSARNGNGPVAAGTTSTTTTTPPRILYVAQGERANATANEWDVLVSDKATTCHILAFRSTRGSRRSGDDRSRSTDGPDSSLTSLTHLDGVTYESCVRTMIQEHVRHHHHHHVEDEEKKSDDTGTDVSASAGATDVTIEVHVMGGFNDQDSTSSTITDWLIGLLARIASEYKQQEQLPQQPRVEMILKTCAVSCMNDTGFSCPVGRGLGIDLHTGDVFLASCDGSVMGPVPVLRSVRLWSKTPDDRTANPSLTVIHSSTGEGNRMLVVVRPFAFASFPDLESLLALPDDVLIQYTSTSPDVEEDGFCRSVREAMEFLRRYDCRQVFGPDLDRPLVFRRNSWNEWKRVRTMYHP